MPNPEGKGEVSKMGCVRVAHSKVLISVSPNRVLLSNCNDYYNYNMSERKKQREMTLKNVTLDELGNNPDLLLTTKQVMNLLGVSGPTLYRWRKINLIPFYRVGGLCKYRADEIVKFLKNNEI